MIVCSMCGKKFKTDAWINHNCDKEKRHDNMQKLLF
jgi:hypothetical protein